jgi:hypothetical protein
VLRLARILLVVVVGWLLLRLLRSVDWSEVAYALTHLEIWQMVALLAAVAVRRFVLAAPLALFIPGLGQLRAMVNDVAAAAVATLTPSPGDVVLRLAMIRSWGIDATNAASGLTLSTVLFYVARLAAPVLGFFTFWAGRSFYAPFGWAAFVFGAGAVVLLVGLLYALRAERSAAAVGRLLGRALRRVRPASTGPDAWAQRLTDFQSHSARNVRSQGLLAGLSLVGVVVTETAVFVLCLAFVGVPLDRADLLVVACSFLVIYPLTGLPLMGAGILDATYAAFVSSHSDLDATSLVAGLLVWRVAVQVLPVVVGLSTIAWWRRTEAVRDR